MKKVAKVFTALTILGLSAVATKSSAQATATDDFDADITLVNPITITKVDDMHFGNVTVGGTSGTVAIATNGSRSASGGVTLPATAGTYNPASFTVHGEPNYTYGITLPNTTSISFATGTITFSSIVSAPLTVGTLDGTGDDLLKIGATLDIPSGHVAGTYTAAAIPVTVVYN